MGVPRSGIGPSRLVELLECAERPRVGDWTLRSALTRYAQREPRRVADLLTILRRLEAALAGRRSDITALGPRLWTAFEAFEGGGDDGTEPAPLDMAAPSGTRVLLDLLRILAAVDALGERLAAWAEDPAVEAPRDELDRVIAFAADELDRVGIPRDESGGRPGRRRGPAAGVRIAPPSEEPPRHR
ncbi:MAG: hypothetical protein R2698_11990 [Microthrixaceae bacterium]